MVTSSVTFRSAPVAGWRRSPAPAPRAPRKGVAEDLAEDVAVAVERIAARTARAKFEARAARRPAGGESRRTDRRRRAPSKPWNFGLPSASISPRSKRRAVLLVADDLIGLVGGGKTVLRLGIIRILVRMMLLGEFAVGRFYVLGRCVLGNAQHLIGIAHASCLEMSWNSYLPPICARIGRNSSGARLGRSIQPNG